MEVAQVQALQHGQLRSLGLHNLTLGVTQAPPHRQCGRPEHRVPQPLQSRRAPLRRDSIVCMGGHSHAPAAPKEPEFQPSGWVEKDILERRPDLTTAGEELPYNYGIDDNHHTRRVEDLGDPWELFQQAMKEAGPPTGVQGLMTAAFLPILFGCVVYGVDADFLLGGTSVFVVLFCTAEALKPATENNFERDRTYGPERYGGVKKLPAPIEE